MRHLIFAICLICSPVLANDPPPPEGSGLTVAMVVADLPSDPGPHTQLEAESKCDTMETEVQSADTDGFDNDVRAAEVIHNWNDPSDETPDTLPEVEERYNALAVVLLAVEMIIDRIWETPGYVTRYGEAQGRGDSEMVNARWMREIARLRLEQEKWTEAYNAASRAIFTASEANTHYAEGGDWLGEIETGVTDINIHIDAHLDDQNQGDE